jgi:hypothetical protein
MLEQMTDIARTLHAIDFTLGLICIVLMVLTVVFMLKRTH